MTRHLESNYGAKGSSEVKGDARPLYSHSGHVVAQVKTDRNKTRFLFKRIDQHKHCLKCPPSIAIDQTVLTQAKDLGAEYVLVMDKNTKETWRTSIATFEEHSLVVNRGHGRQLALCFIHWKHTDPNGGPAPAPPELPLTVIEPKVKQLDLFCEGRMAA